MSETLTPKELSFVLRTMSRSSCISLEALTDKVSLIDVGMDSLDFDEFIMAVEDDSDTMLDNDDRDKVDINSTSTHAVARIVNSLLPAELVSRSNDEA
jgi:hypothetical protein